MKLLSVGADPELFVMRGGTIIPVIGLLGGTKKRPRKVTGGAVQEDNVLAEFNINPATTADEFVTNLNIVMGQLDQHLAKYGAATHIKASHDFSMDALESAGEKAFMFGCDPDYNAWTLSRNVAPFSGDTLRTAGGHVHLGLDKWERDDLPEVIKRMDLFLGVPSLLMDDDDRRRSMYGAAGSFRPKPYGVEYRSLSNFWLRSENHMRWVFDMAHRAVEEDVVVPSLVQEVINSADRSVAEKLVREYNIPLVS